MLKILFSSNKNVISITFLLILYEQGSIAFRIYRVSDFFCVNAFTGAMVIIAGIRIALSHEIAI